MAHEQNDIIISVKDLMVGFGNTTVLDHVALEVKRGEILGFVGASGAGKSVLMRTIIGLLPMALKLGEGSESYAPLARALLGGLTLSVVLTVFLVPAAYLLVYGKNTAAS